MRRGPDDKEWQDLKKRIFKRDDGHCRLLKILSLKEMLLFQKLYKEKNQKYKVDIIDPAHIFPVSLYPHLCYEATNVILLNRFAHDLLEDHLSPLTGERLEEADYNLFLIRILGMNVFSTLASWAKNPEGSKKEKKYA